MIEMGGYGAHRRAAWIGLAAVGVVLAPAAVALNALSQSESTA